MKRLATLLSGAVLVGSLLAPLTSAAPAAADSGSDAAALVAAINNLRAGRGLAPLAVDTRLTNLALWWTNQMVASGRLAENPNMASMFPPGWTRIGENVGYAGSAAAVEAAFEGSPDHLANMLQPDFNTVGIGAVWTGGTLWVTEDFMAGVAAQVAPPPPPVVWTGWSVPSPPPPAGVAGSPSVASWAPGRFDQFVLGGDGRLWHAWSSNGGANFGNWEDLGAPNGPLTSSPAAVSWGAGRIDVFGRGSDRALWHRAWDGSAWSPWESLGGQLSSAPTVASWGPGRLDVFVAGADLTMFHRWWGGAGWSAWEDLGGQGVFDPAATSWGPGRVDLFTVGTDGALWHDVYQAGWSAWIREFQGSFGSGPGAAAWAPGRVDLLIGAGGQGAPVSHVWYANGRWQSESLGGALTMAPSAVSWGPGRLDAFVRGVDGNLWHDAYPGG